MKANPLLVALVLLVVLGGAVYYTRENPPEIGESKPALLKTEEKNVQELVIRKQDGETIGVRRGEDEKWQFLPPIEVAADDGQIGFLVANLSKMDADRVVKDTVESWGPFGLEGDGSMSLDVKLKEGEPRKIIFGADTPTGSGVFARIDGDPRLMTAYAYTKTSFDKKLFDLRDKRMLRVEADKISGLKLKVGGSVFDLSKGADSDWRITAPRSLRADNFTVDDLARAAYSAEMTTILEEGEPSGAFSFSNPLAEVEIVDDVGAHALVVAKGEGDKYYAKSSDLDGVYEVGATLAESLGKDLDELRNKKPFDFGFTTVKSLSVRDGETVSLFERSGEKWLLASDNGREMSAGLVQTLIDSLRNLTAVSFPPEDGAGYGLDAPEIEAEVLLDEEAAVPEKVLISSLSADRVYAQRDGEPAVYEIEKAPAEEIRRALDDALKVDAATEAEAREDADAADE